MRIVVVRLDRVFRINMHKRCKQGVGTPRVVGGASIARVVKRYPGLSSGRLWHPVGKSWSSRGLH